MTLAFDRVEAEMTMPITKRMRRIKSYEQKKHFKPSFRCAPRPSRLATMASSQLPGAFPVQHA
ncbi:hypothetical protein PsorP6_018399 [Peronosclerospora sorghi]|nr:hypothetical protein PsorP6_018378 [Peronosclerospora sorghi]KAI9895588.1 hypothetical protein PsorP6_018399 [Peronosclerospora sorghi]